MCFRGITAKRSKIDRSKKTDRYYMGASRRASFDESHEEVINGYRVKFSDLLNNNTESVVGGYIHQLSGHIALARMGIKSKEDYSKILNRVIDGYNLPEVAAKYKGRIGEIKKKFEIETQQSWGSNALFNSFNAIGGKTISGIC